MIGTTTASQERAGDAIAERPCGSAEAAVVRWALAHLGAGRVCLPAVRRDEALVSDEPGRPAATGHRSGEQLRDHPE